MLSYVRGDATYPQGEGTKLIIHICNNIGAWGAGFVVSISNRWKAPEAAYRAWFDSDERFELGRIQPVLVQSEPNEVWVINMVAQHGIGSRNGPPIRYYELKVCLKEVAKLAKEKGASIHMPRIGSGLAGGRWEIIERIIKETLCDSGIYVTVYDLGVS